MSQSVTPRPERPKGQPENIEPPIKDAYLYPHNRRQSVAPHTERPIKRAGGAGTGPRERGPRPREPRPRGPGQGGPGSGVLGAGGAVQGGPRAGGSGAGGQVYDGSSSQNNTPSEQKQPTNWTPNPKLATGVGAGTPLAVIVTYIAQAVGLELPEDVALAICGLIIGVIGYFTPPLRT